MGGGSCGVNMNFLVIMFCSCAALLKRAKIIDVLWFYGCYFYQCAI